MEQSTFQTDLAKKLKALMVVRLIVVTLVLVAGSLVLQVERIPFYTIIAIFYFTTIIYAVLLRLHFPLYILAYTQIIIDVLLETVIIHYGGGADSIYAFLYVPSIVAGGVIISGRAAKMVAGLSSIFYGALSGSEFFGVIPPIPGAETVYREGPWVVMFIVSFRIIIFCLIGYLSSYLSQHLYRERSALYRLRNLVDLVLNNISSGVITVDSKDKLLYINPTAQDILGVKDENLTDIYWPRIFWVEPDKDRVDRFIIQAKTSNGAELDVLRPDGKKLVLRCNYSPLQDENGKAIGGVITFSDLTILKELELIAKPFAVEELRLLVKRALEHRKLLRENILLKKEIGKKPYFENIVGKSAAMQRIYEMIEKVARTDSTVLIYGGSGSGKELVARAIHYSSQRRDKPFVAINCGGLPEGLLESELFGHVKGAFTGAISDKVGLFQVANGGIIFLDEVSATSPTIQVKLLRVLQEREIKRVGGTKDIPVDVRVLAATNKRLDEEVKKGEFREDLYYRLSVIPIELPPLRERKEDIPLLVQHFLDKHSGTKKENLKVLAPEVIDIFLGYDWPGNVRELENVIERAITLCEGEKIQPGDLPQRLIEKSTFLEPSLPTTSLKEVMRQKEREYVQKVIHQTRGDKKAAAKILGIDLATLYRKL